MPGPPMLEQGCAGTAATRRHQMGHRGHAGSGRALVGWDVLAPAPRCSQQGSDEYKENMECLIPITLN